MSWSQPLLRTPLFDWQSSQNARMVESDGWQVPSAYTHTDQEVLAGRAGVGLADLSAFAKVRWTGPGVAGRTEALVGDGAAGKPLGVSTFSAGGMVFACRLRPDHLLLLTSTTNPAPLTKHLASVESPAAVVQSDATSDYASFGLVGPHLDEMLRAVPLFDLGPDSLPEGACAETNLAGVQALLVRPISQDLPKLRIYVAWDVGEHTWDTLMKVGRRFGLTPVGMEAWKRLTAHSPDV